MRATRVTAVTAANSVILPYVQVIFPIIFLAFAFEHHWSWWLLTAFVYFLTGCLGVSVTFHRFLTHRSFSMPKWMEYLFSFFGAMGGTGSSIGWVSIHKQHHAHSDTHGDPHSPRHLGWRVLMATYNHHFSIWHVRRMVTDRFHVILHNYYFLIWVGWGAFLLAIDWRVFLFGFLAPVSIQIWISNLSNLANHTRCGYRNFETGEDSVNCVPVALLTFGEGWHNNHHQYPGRWNFRVKWWEIDPSAWVIGFIRWTVRRV